MPVVNGFEPARFQVTLYPREAVIFPHNEAVVAILPLSSARYSGKLEILPLPENAPPDFPRAGMRSKDGQWAVQIFGNRIDSTWTLQDRGSSAPSNVLEECLGPLLATLKASPSLIIGRVGIVTTRTRKSENPSLELMQRFCNSKVIDPSNDAAPFRNSLGFQLHNLKRYELSGSGFSINSWVRCRTGTYKNDNQAMIEFEQDINSVAEKAEEYSFDANNLAAFCGKVQAELDSILRLYFEQPQGAIT